MDKEALYGEVDVLYVCRACWWKGGIQYTLQPLNAFPNLWRTLSTIHWSSASILQSPPSALTIYLPLPLLYTYSSQQHKPYSATCSNYSMSCLNHTAPRPLLQPFSISRLQPYSASFFNQTAPSCFDHTAPPASTIQRPHASTTERPVLRPYSAVLLRPYSAPLLRPYSAPFLDHAVPFCFNHTASLLRPCSAPILRPHSALLLQPYTVPASTIQRSHSSTIQCPPASTIQRPCFDYTAPLYINYTASPSSSIQRPLLQP